MKRTFALTLAAALAAGCLQFDVKARTNKAPLAKAAAPETVLLGEAVKLDGRGSTDPDEDPLTFRWEQVEGTGDPVALSNADSPEATFTAPDRAQRLFFRLLVDDGVAQTAAVAGVDVIVRPNQPPSAVAPGTMAAFVGETVILDGSASTDPDAGDALSYDWAQVAGAGDPVAITDAFTPVATFTAPDFPQRLFFRLTVSDGLEFSAAVTRVDVTERPNAAPVAAAPESIEAVTASVVVLDGSASSDPDDADVLSFRWEQVEGSGDPVQIHDADKARATFNAPDRGQRLFFRLIVNDGLVDSQPALVRVDVNAAPLAEAGPRLDVPNQTAVIVEGSAVDPDGDPIASWKWTVTGAPAAGAACVADPSPCLSGANTAEPTFTPPAKGDYVLSLVVSDGVLPSLPDSTRVRSLNRPPQAVAGADEVSVPNGTTLTLRSGDSADPDGDGIVQYKWTLTDLPPGAIATMVPSNGLVAAPDLTLGGKGSYFLTLVVTDEDGLESAPAQLRLDSLNNVPVANAGPDRAVTNGAETTVLGLASDPDNDPYTYLWALVDTPTGGNVTLNDADKQGVRLTPTKKTVKQEPAQCAAGECYVLELTVSDGIEISAPDRVTLTTLNRPPVANAGPDVLDPSGQVTLSGANSSDPDGDTLTSYEWFQIEGPDLTGGDGVIEGQLLNFTPTVSAVYTFDLVVSDGALDSTADRVLVRVGNVNRPPVLSLAAVTSVAPEETAFPSLDATQSTDPDNDTLTITWTRKTGSVLFPSTRVGKTPTITAPPFVADGSNVATYEVIAEDSRGLRSAATETVTLSVVPGAGYVIVSSAPGATDTPSSGTCGIAAQPCRSLKKALALIDPDANLIGDGRSIIMTSGQFSETVGDTLALQIQWPGGVNLYGGRDPVTFGITTIPSALDVRMPATYGASQYGRGLYFGAGIGAGITIERLSLSLSYPNLTQPVEALVCDGCKATFRDVGVTVPGKNNYSHGVRVMGAGASPLFERAVVNVDGGGSNYVGWSIGVTDGATATVLDSLINYLADNACCANIKANIGIYLLNATLTLKRSRVILTGDDTLGNDNQVLRSDAGIFSVENSVLANSNTVASGVRVFNGGVGSLRYNTIIGSGSTNVTARGIWADSPISIMGNLIAGFQTPIAFNVSSGTAGKGSLVFANVLHSTAASLMTCPTSLVLANIADVNAITGEQCNASSANWTDNKAGNCALVDPSSGDFHLNGQIANICKDGGIAASAAGLAPADDFEKGVRPQGSAPDIGADETG